MFEPLTFLWENEEILFSLLPLIHSGNFSPENVFAVVGNQDTVSSAIAEFPKGISVVSSEDPIAKEVWTAPIQLLAVKPHQLDQVKSKAPDLSAISESSRPLLISILSFS